MEWNEYSAMDIYHMADRMEAKQYFYELRNAIYRELKSGRCELLEWLIEIFSHCVGKTVQVPVFVYLACSDVRMVIRNGGTLKNREQGLQVDKDNFYPWPEFERQQGLKKLVYRLKPNEVREFMNSCRTACNHDRQNAACGVVHYSGSDFAWKDEQALEKARKEAEQIKKQAHADAEKITDAARVNADQYIIEAKEQAARIIAEAERRAKNREADVELLLDGAQQRAEQIRLEARNEAKRLISIAKDDAKDIRDTARQQAEEEAEQNVKTLTQQKLSAHIHELRRQWEEDQLENARQRNEVSSLGAALKEEACTVSTAVGVRLNRDLEQLQEQINQLRSNVTVELQQWRASLYQCEYGKLVNFYNTLNGYANSFERELREAECDDNISEELKKILGEHSRKMNRLRNILSGAMEPMGLRTFTPQKGDLFNSYYHATNDDEDDDVFLDCEIERCLKPGIERVVNDREVAVLLRASVEVRKD